MGTVVVLLLDRLSRTFTLWYAIVPHSLTIIRYSSWELIARNVIGMKKFFMLVSLGMMSISSFAQVQWDVTVRKEPDYSKYGVQYQSTQTPDRRVPDPYEINRRNSEMYQNIERKWAEEERAYEEANQVVSKEVQLLNGIKLGTNQSTPIRANVETRRNGRVDITCMGIKNGQTWKPCNKPIISLQSMYNNAKSESEKSMILDLMDMGSYLLDTGNEMYIVK